MSDTPRGVVRHCPYCAEEDLWPVEDPSGGWECRACARVFTVQLVRLEAAHIHGRVAEEQELQRREQP
jgi:hypothetical protein